MKKKSGLGRGLSALLGDNDTLEAADAQAQAGQIHLLEPKQIEPNPFQPRRYFDPEALDELAESIRVQGVIQPITVRRMEEGRYQLIAGERRWQASQKAGLKQVPAFVRPADDRQMLEIALIENVQRQDLNAMEVAYSYQRLISELGIRQEDLTERVGKKRSTIANYLRLLRLPEDIQKSVEQETLSMGHARAIMGLDNLEDQLFVFKKIGTQHLSVRATEQLVRQLQEPEKEAKTDKTGRERIAPHQTELDDIRNQLTTRLGTKVAIKNKPGNKGEITIPYYNLDDLNRVLEILL